MSASHQQSSSRTSHKGSRAGSPPSSETCESLDTYRVPSCFLPESAELRTAALEPSSLPTPTAASYGSSNNGNPGDHREEYATKGKPSLWTMAERGDLPGHPRGPLSPEWVEWAMGFPEGWTVPDSGQTGFGF